jgi:hypothetical protein
MGKRMIALLAVGALLVPAGGWAQDQVGDAVRNWSAITECGGISDDQRRLGCMDDVLRQAGIAGGSSSASAPDQAARAAQPSSAAARGLAATARAAPEPARDLTEALTTTITSVQTVGYQRLRVTTAAGGVWEQTQAEALRTPPRVGDTFHIEPAALGSYRCRVERSSLYRCKPAG